MRNTLPCFPIYWHSHTRCRYNPVNFVQRWSTPQLVVHGSRDYRLPETDGIGAFHALQQYVLVQVEAVTMSAERGMRLQVEGPDASCYLPGREPRGA